MSEKTNAITPDLRKISALFDIRADFVHGIPYGSGHINDTYCASFDQAGLRLVRYILQRINTNVLPDAGATDGKHRAGDPPLAGAADRGGASRSPQADTQVYPGAQWQALCD